MGAAHEVNTLKRTHASATFAARSSVWTVICLHWELDPHIELWSVNNGPATALGMQVG